MELTRFQKWSREGLGDYDAAPARLSFLAEHLFEEYEPARGHSLFMDRFARWLDSAGSDDDSRLLIDLLKHVYFVGRGEFEVLYREAFHGPIMWWLLGTDIRLGSEGAALAVEEAVRDTWFCPITDSMQIARFHHLNQIVGKDLRPDWRTLASFGDPKRVRNYMDEHGFTKLVLLEDFVGTGNQAAEAIRFALDLRDDLEIFVLSLIICPEGLSRLQREADSAGGRVTIAASVVVPAGALLRPDAQAEDPEIFARFRELLVRLDPLVGNMESTGSDRLFGFRSTGALVVLYTNCPNNAPPVLHWASDSWSPVFPRSERR